MSISIHLVFKWFGLCHTWQPCFSNSRRSKPQNQKVDCSFTCSNYWNNPGYMFSYFRRTQNSLPASNSKQAQSQTETEIVRVSLSEVFFIHSQVNNMSLIWLMTDYQKLNIRAIVPWLLKPMFRTPVSKSETFRGGGWLGWGWGMKVA